MVNVPGTRCPLRLRFCQRLGLEQHSYWLKIKKMFILYFEFEEAGERSLVLEGEGRAV